MRFRASAFLLRTPECPRQTTYGYQETTKPPYGMSQGPGLRRISIIDQGGPEAAEHTSPRPREPPRKGPAKSEKNEQIAEVVVIANGGKYRAASEEKDLYASIDKDIDILEGQIRKMKTKKEKQNLSDSIKLKESLAFSKEDNQVEDEILKTLYYDIKPMAPEDAKMILQEKTKNNFLPFINIDTGKVNVIYKLKDGKNFGLV